MTDMNILFVASVVHEKLLIEILKTQPRYYGIQGQYFMRLMLLGLKANGVKVNVLSTAILLLNIFQSFSENLFMLIISYITSTSTL